MSNPRLRAVVTQFEFKMSHYPPSPRARLSSNRLLNPSFRRKPEPRLLFGLGLSWCEPWMPAGVYPEQSRRAGMTKRASSAPQYRLCQMISIPFAPLLVVVVPTFQSGAISYSIDTSRPCSPESCCEAET